MSGNQKRIVVGFVRAEQGVAVALRYQNLNEVSAALAKGPWLYMVDGALVNSDDFIRIALVNEDGTP